MIESEYRNDLTSSMGATGMFQFLAPTAQKYGLTPEERTDTEKAANAAAKFLSELQNQFADDAMKEVLALTAYNQGPKAVKESLSLVVNEKNKSCSLCVLNENKTRLNQNMQTEGLKYVPTFFAAAIVGENPQSFGIQLNPLSSYTK
jgi:membrane-bound lytic murein transglycosylase D